MHGACSGFIVYDWLSNRISSTFLLLLTSMLRSYAIQLILCAQIEDVLGPWLPFLFPSLYSTY